MIEIYEPDSFDPRKSLGYLLHRLRSALLAAVDRELASDSRLASLDVTAAQSLVIAGIAAEGAQSAAKLCKAFSYDAGAMTRMIDRLESKDLLRRNRSTSDRRVVIVELTNKGHTSLPQMREAFRVVLNRSLTGLEISKVRQLEKLLSHMLSNL